MIERVTSGKKPQRELKGLSSMDFKAAAATLGAISYPSHLRMLKLLSEREWLQKDLAEALDLSRTTISQHILRMKARGLIRSRYDWPNRLFSADTELAKKLVALIESLEASEGTDPPAR